MAKITLGKTGIKVEKNAFGALPIQRISTDEAVHLLQKAQSGGMDYFDTARVYSDSEEKIGKAFEGRRDRVIIATKTEALTAKDLKKDLETSLKTLKTDHIDIYQFHNTPFCPKPDQENGMYEAMLEAKKQGKIRHIGITNHRWKVAREAIDSGLFETLQFPFSYLSGETELGLEEECRKHDMGFICMKGLSGGLIQSSAAAYLFMTQYDVLPIWGIQREKELDEFLSYIGNPPQMTEELRKIIEEDRKELQGDFCRGCGYCQPCPEGIKIEDCARRSLLMRRAPLEPQLTKTVQEDMKQVEKCVHCGLCSSRCPYGLDTPSLLEKNYEDYKNVLSGKTVIKQ